MFRCCSSASADDAVALSPLDMHDVQHAVSERPADGSGPVRAGAIIDVDGERVGEHGGRFLELDAVFVQILGRLDGVPLEMPSIIVAIVRRRSMGRNPYEVKRCPIPREPPRSDDPGAPSVG